MLAALSPPAHVAADTLSDLDDAQARVQYAFYTADVRTLEDVVAMIEQLEVPQPLAALKAYSAAYGEWKLAELHGADAPIDKRTLRSSSAKAAHACLVHTNEALGLDPRMTEAYVLDTACNMVTESRTESLKARPACARSKSLRTAQQLEPKNPRVLLIEAMCLHGTDVASSTAAFDRLRGVVAAFEAAPPAKPGAADWGQAEALLMLGEDYLQRGESHAARDVIEKALVIAPDYRKARALLDTANIRPH
jgi:tetratricopeptide (TPR) repeat protein